jgi:hypothetical protein
MARAAGSGAYLSGIATMLTQTNVCAACGRIHEDSLFRFRAEQAEDCPVTLGAFPMMAGLGDPEAGESDTRADAREVDVELPYALPPSAVPKQPVLMARRSGLSIPWIMPTDREEFL